MQDGRADLHLHTTHSDGKCSPAEVIEKCAAHDLRAVAIVDHDEISALETAIACGEERGVEVIAGVELSVRFQARDIHILGYGFNYQHSELVAYLAFLRAERRKRARQILQRLSQMGMPLLYDDVVEKAGPGSIGRPHIARAMMEKGYVRTFQEAFNRFIGDGRPASVPKHRIGIDAAVKLVYDAGGVCSLAHPGLFLTDAQVMELVKTGLTGIEVVHPKHNEARTRFFQQLARENDMLETGGSDFHGGTQGEEALGKYTVPYAVVEQIKRLVRA